MSLPEGVTLEESSEHAVVVIHEFTEELKALLRSRLAALCYGTSFIADRPAFFSFKRTTAEFLARYNAKDENTRIGMMGELLTHLLAEDVYPQLTNFSVYFNKEERSIKKGFDATFIELSNGRLWYTEVKSGRLGEEDVHGKARALFGLASTDLGQKLGAADRGSLWTAAMTDATLTLLGTNIVTVKELLQDDYTTLEEEGSFSSNVLLAAVDFEDVSAEHLDLANLESRLGTLTRHGSFNDVKYFAIQKSTIEKIVAFFETEAAAQ